MYTFKKIDFDKIVSTDKCFSNCSEIFTTYEWLKFIKEACHVEIIILEIFNDNDLAGYFYGGLFKKFGVKIIGSPFNGWNTPYMGCNLKADYDINDILKDLWSYLKKEYKVMYFEICDKSLDASKLKLLGIKNYTASTYALDISEDKDIVFSRFSKHCRRNINYFTKKGAYIKELNLKDNFIDEFYDMITKVFAYQNLKPPYSKEKIKVLFNTIPKEKSLYVGAYNPEGKCIGYLASYYNKNNCYTLISATERSENYKQKNYLRWYAIQYFKNKGAKHLDMIGKRPYKLEFNPVEESFVGACFSRFKVLFLLKRVAKKCFWLLNKIKFSFQKNS